MLFVLLGFDVEDSMPIRQTVRPAHLARIEALQVEGRLIIAGPMPKPVAEPASASGSSGPGIHGSIIIAEFASQEDATTWLAADPYALHGVFARTHVYPFRQVLP